MSGAGSRENMRSNDFRDRSDSMSAFKKYEKMNNNDLSSTPLSNPLISPSVHPSAANVNPNFSGQYLGPSQQ